jgi:D-arabinose 1-dehydrogenase-like Zn-dependent alcohol dehydrogenase
LDADHQDDYMAALRPAGKLCVLGIGDKEAVSPWSLIFGEKQLVGGIPGAIVETRQMLAFAARGVREEWEFG